MSNGISRFLICSKIKIFTLYSLPLRGSCHAVGVTEGVCKNALTRKGELCSPANIKKQNPNTKKGVCLYAIHNL